jgi:CRP-like cAMP-binding protein
MTPRLVAAGTELIRQGEQGASMFVLAEGLLEVWHHDGTRSVKLAAIEPGEFAGEMSLLTGEARSASIVAASEALLYELTAESLMPVLAARPQLFEAISELVALRRLGNTKLLAAAASPQAIEQVRGVTAQILARMRIFFAKLSVRPAGVAVQFGD